MVRVSTRTRTSSVHHPVTTTPTSNPLSYRHWCETLVEILLIIANRYCGRYAGFPVRSSPHKKFQKCAARVLIRPGVVKLFYIVDSTSLSWPTTSLVLFNKLKLTITLVNIVGQFDVSQTTLLEQER